MIEKSVLLDPDESYFRRTQIPRQNNVTQELTPRAQGNISLTELKGETE